MTKWYHQDPSDGTPPIDPTDASAQVPPAAPQNTPSEAPMPPYTAEAAPPAPEVIVPPQPTSFEEPAAPVAPPVPPAPAAPVEPPMPVEPPAAPAEPSAPPVPPAPAAPPEPPVPPQPPTPHPTGGYYGVPRSPYGAPTSLYGMTPPAPMPPAPPKKKKPNPAVIVLAVVCGLSLLLSCILGVMVITNNGASGNDRDEAGYAESDDRDDEQGNELHGNGPTLQISDAEPDDGGLSTSEIVSRNLDATVVLTMYEQSTSIYDFYGYSFGGSSELVKASEASGIIMSEDGYIITNSHCVFNEESQKEYARIDVTLYDGTVYEKVDIVGYDPTTDLAVIKIDANGLQVAQFGDSSALALGDRVITLGNSGGLQWSVSQGVLSGQARDVYEDTGYAIKCLQVDAVINPGSSGGPLFNAYGQVVGVNSAKIVLTGYEGLGFSIPINEAKPVIDDLIKHGYVTGRVALGITGRTITSLGYEGFMIEEIAEGSAFDGTQVRAGDIITHVNGDRVMDYAEMRAKLTSYEVGDTVTLTLIRLNQQNRQVQEYTVDVVLKESK